jgi:hypothetical protein
MNVMVFVNEVAEIIHSTVNKFVGFPHQNLGDAFLIIWKYDEQDYIKIGNELVLKNTFRVSNFCDLSIVAFLKVVY